MAERILGLDIGADALYAVLLERPAGGGARITKTYARQFSAGEELEGAIKNLVSETGASFSRVVTSLPLAELTVRHLQLPFQDKKKIGEVLPFELAALLGRPLGDAALDFLLVGQGKPQDVLAILSSRASVQERLARLRNNGLTDAILEGSGFILGSQAGPYVNQKGLAVILDLGKAGAASVWLDRGQLCHVRALSYGVSGESPWEGRDLPAPAALAAFIADLSGEVQNTHAFLQLRGFADGEIIQVYLTGIGSLFPGIAEMLAESLHVPVEQLDLCRRIPLALEENVARGWVGGLMDQALALALRSRSGGLDFAKSQQPDNPPLQWSGRAKILWLILLLLIGLEGYLDYKLAQNRFFSLKSEVSEVFKRHYPGGGRQVDPVQQMKGLIEQRRKEQTGIVDLTGGPGVLSVLQELSVLILAGQEVLLHSLSLEEGNMAIKGEARDFETVEKVREALARSPLFSSVTLGATNLQKDAKTVTFDLAIRVTK